MIFTLNGTRQALDAPLSVTALLKAHGYGDMMVAVARNGSFLPRSLYATTCVEEGDEIEVLAPMQGG